MAAQLLLCMVNTVGPSFTYGDFNFDLLQAFVFTSLTTHLASFPGPLSLRAQILRMT